MAAVGTVILLATRVMVVVSVGILSLIIKIRYQVRAVTAVPA